MISNLSITPLGFGAFRLNWSSDEVDPIFRIYRDGQLLGVTTAGSWTVTIAAADQTPVFEILDDPDEIPRPGYPSQVVLAWYAASGATSYRIDELVGATWTARQTLLARSGQSYYKWTSRALEDDTTHQFRIVPIGANANDGTVAALAVLMVRHPDPPAAQMSYDPDDGTLTIA